MTNTLNKIMHNGDEYDLPEGFTPDNAGTTDDVLTKTADGYEWATPIYTATVSSSQPSTPLEGQLWYDTGNSVLKIYDGSAWQTI